MGAERDGDCEYADFPSRDEPESELRCISIVGSSLFDA